MSHIKSKGTSIAVTYTHLQEILLLRFGQELTLRQIAQVTGVPLRTVQSRLRAALKKLKSQLEKEEHCDK